MQDIRTGDLVPLDPKMFENNKQAAMDAVVPRRFQGPVFTIGEIIEVKGGKFRVQSIKTRGRLVLHGVPS